MDSESQKSTPPSSPAGRAEPGRRSRLTPRPSHRGSSGRRWWLILALIVVAAGFAVKPLWERLQRWQAENLVSQGEELMRQQMYPEAIERLDTALQLQPQFAPALRALAGIYSRFDLPYGLPVWRNLLNLPDHTANDRQRYIDLALRLERFDLAEAELAQLLASTNVNNATRAHAAEFFYRQGDLARALDFSQQLRASDPTNRVHAFRTARILIQMPGREEQQKGLALLRELVPAPGNERAFTYRAISDSPRLNSTDANAFLDAVPPGRTAQPLEYLAYADARIRLNPASRTDTVADALKRYRNSTPEHQAELGTWLNEIGEHALLAETYTLAQASPYPPVAAAYLEALARSGLWERLRDDTAEGLPLDGWMLACLRAAAARHLGQESLAAEYWRRALDDAAGNAARLRSLGDFALRIGESNRAIEAFEQLTRDRLSRVTGYRRLAQLYEEKRDTERLRDIMRDWSGHVPDDPTPENAFCYLSGLLRRDVEPAYARAQRLLERLPNRLALRTTLALLELRRDQPRAALALFERTRLDIRQAPPQTRLVYAATLDANGRSEAARALTADIKADQLLPEEKDLLRRVLRVN